MTVAELLAELEKVPPDAEVYMDVGGDYWPVRDTWDDRGSEFHLQAPA